MKLRVADDEADIEFHLEKDGHDVRLYGRVVRTNEEYPILEITEDGFLRLFNIPEDLTEVGINVNKNTDCIMNEMDAEEEE